MIPINQTIPSSHLISDEGEELNFSILRVDGSKYPSVKKAYLKTFIITEEDIEIGQLKDSGIVWPLYIEPEVIRHIYESFWPTKCIVSFQVHTWGKAAIARLYKDMKGAI